LNMISTITMIRSGRTYGNFMVDVVASNSKLVDRAARIVSDITGTQVPRAREVLESAGRDVKTAVVMIERGVGADDARALLAAHGNRLGPALRGA
ncbi:MAG: N-acetylmuramic acid 6-phosphate etherase, partial [Thermobispora bispora]|nr:N-acetylmuramic acid 6-phosphate etherase [Thermobispora bispora]